MLKVLVIIAVTVLILIVSLPFYLIWINMQPMRSETGLRPNGEYRTLDFRSDDGIALRAWLLVGRPDSPTIVMVHGKGDSKSGLLHLAAPLQAVGYNVLLPDLRGHGESDDAKITFGLDEARDVRAAVAAANVNGPIGVYGLSMGTAAAILALGEDTRVKGWVIDSGFGSLEDLMVDIGVRFYGLPRWITTLSNIAYRVLAGAHPRDVAPANALGTAPALFFHARDDNTIPIEHGRVLFNAARGKKSFIETDGDHVSCWGSDPKRYEELLVIFFNGVFSNPEFDPKAACRTF